MPFTTGTVTQAHGVSGLLQGVIIPWITGAGGTPGRDWTVELNQNAKNSAGADTSHGATCKEYVLSNSGYSGNDNVIIGFREGRRAATDLYEISLNVYTSVPATYFFDNQLLTGFTAYDATNEGWTSMPSLQLIDSTMTYWIYSSPSRVTGYIKVSSNYYGFYVGFGRPLGSPEEYPFPGIAAGSAAFPTPHTSGGRGLAAIADPNTSVMIIGPGNEYKTLEFVRIYPTHGITDTTPYQAADDGRSVMFPLYLCFHDDGQDFNIPQEMWMTYDKVYNTRVANQQSEDIYADGRYDYRIFQGGSSVNVTRFVGIKEPVSTTTSTTTTTTTTT